MRIITKKEEQEIESIKKQNEFLSKGYRALNIALDYQSAIVAILKTVDMKEIEKEVEEESEMVMTMMI